MQPSNQLESLEIPLETIDALKNAWEVEAIYEEWIESSNRLSIEDFSEELLQKIESGKVSTDQLDHVIRRLSALGLIDNAKHKKQSVDFKEGIDFENRVDSFMNGFIYEGDAKRSMKEVEKRLSQRILCLVQTGHPTYDQKTEVMKKGHQFIKKEINEWEYLEYLEKEDRLSEPDHRIEKEDAHAIKMAENMVRGWENIYEIILKKIKKEYPDSWMDFKLPKFPNWSWFLTDMDGRNDLSPEKALDGLYKRAEHSLGMSIDFMNHHQLTEGETYQELNQLYSHLKNGHSNEQLVFSSKKIIEKIDQEIEMIKSRLPIDEKKLAAFKILQMNFVNSGINLAGTHVRANQENITSLAGQMDELGEIKVGSYEEAMELMKNLDRDPKHKALNLLKLSYCIQQTIDRDHPIVYLISDTNKAETVKLCLEASQKIGIEHLQIHPLIEDKTGIENATQMIRELLEDENYRNYIKKQGALFIQTGHSDLGRRAGQVAGAYKLGNVYNEICDELLAREIKKEVAKHPELKNIAIHIFPTGGEKDSRGGNTNLTTRLQLMSPMELRLHKYCIENELQISLTLQGGGGSNWIGSPEMAQNSIMTLLEEFHRPPTNAEKNDPLYHDQEYKKFCDDFFGDVMNFHDELMNETNGNGNHSLAVLLQIYGTMGKPSGSRPMKRESNGFQGMNLFRAIGQAKRYQALGISPSVYGGIGGAANRMNDFNEKFNYLTEHSPRFQVLLDMAYHSFGYTLIDAFESKIKVMDPQAIQQKIDELEAEGEETNKINWLREQKNLLDKFSSYNEVESIMKKLIKDHEETGEILEKYKELRGIKPYVNGEAKKRLRLTHSLITTVIKTLQRKAAREKDNLHPDTLEAIYKLNLHELLIDKRDQIGKLLGHHLDAENELMHLTQVLRNLSDAVDYNNPAMG